MDHSDELFQDVLFEREESFEELQQLSQQPSQSKDSNEESLPLSGSLKASFEKRYSDSYIFDGENSNEELDEKEDDEDDLNSQCLAQKMINSSECSQFYQSKAREKQFSVEELAGEQCRESLYYLSIHKAGLQNVDKSKIHQIIKEASKHSQFFKQEEQKLMEVKEKVAKYRQKVDQAKRNSHMWEKLQIEVRGKIETLKRERFTQRTWIHVDMDAFYAAVEMRDDPSLKDVPLAVGDKNMIMTTNYEARRFGVRSGVPGFIGRKLCPELRFIKPNYAKYRLASEEFKKILREYDPDLESIGLDEAQLDITDYLVQTGQDTREGRQLVASEIRRKIFQATKMTASCGIACNKMLAKICSDLDKPNGQTYLHNSDEEIMKFMRELPVRKLPGVGKVNEQILAGMGIESCQDAYDKSVDIFVNFTENAFDFLLKSSLGIAKAFHEDQGIKKSLNVSQTFATISTYQDILLKLEELCGEMEERCLQQQLSGRTVTVEFKNERFKNKQKSYTQLQYIQSKRELFNVAKSLLEQAWPLDPLRQISVKLLNLKDDNTGKLSYSATEVMISTKGKSKLGGAHKEVTQQQQQQQIQKNSQNQNQNQQQESQLDQNLIQHRVPQMYPVEKFYEQKKKFKPGYYNNYNNSSHYPPMKFKGKSHKPWKKRAPSPKPDEELAYNEKYRSHWVPKEEMEAVQKQKFKPATKPCHDFNEMKAYRNFYKNNKLYISKYKMIMDNEKRKKAEAEKEKEKKNQQQNITTFISKPQIAT